jgi:hypothetical protein
MRKLVAVLFAVLAGTAAEAAPARVADMTSADAVVNWLYGYRQHPQPGEVPAAMQTLSRLGAFNTPERAGVYVGFLAGVVADNADRAEDILARITPIREADQWIIIRAIAYSGIPDWQELLRHFTLRIPRYKVLGDRYIGGKMATLTQFSVPPAPTSFERLKRSLHLNGIFGSAPRKMILPPNPDVLDTLWGYYFATGSYGPILNIVDMLPLSDDHNDAERLTIGSMAKYTLATNAVRDAGLLAILKSTRKARGEPKDAVKRLDSIIDAAETVDTARIRAEALAAIEEVKSKGSAFKRTASWWSYVGQSVIAGGCLAAATLGQVEFGLPCVLGGATASAGMNFINNSPD